MLCVDSLSVSYDGAPALIDISFGLETGETVAVLGPNCAGKSTLLWAISRGVAIDRGDIRFCGESLLNCDTLGVVRRGIAHCPEGRRLFGSLTVAENIYLGLKSAPRPRAEPGEILQFVREIFPLVFERWHQRAGTLSGGEQQMVAIARSIAAWPKLLLLDEPSLGLAPQIVQKLYAGLRRLQSEVGTTILLVEQNVGVALSFATRACLLRRGRLLYSANADDMHSYIQKSSDLLTDNGLNGDSSGHDQRVREKVSK